jgi:hypothetical protein
MIVGYTYRADIYCPEHIRDQIPAAPTVGTVEESLDRLAAHRNIDRADEYSFDSDDFPKPITQESIEREGRLSQCGDCGDAVGVETDSLIHHWETEAAQAGIQAAKDSASWTVDGNQDVAERARVLAMMRDGDPQAFDYLPSSPDLSGEWADGPTPRSIAVEIAGAEPSPETVDVIADAWESGVSDAFESACEAELIKFCE